MLGKSIDARTRDDALEVEHNAICGHTPRTGFETALYSRSDARIPCERYSCAFCCLGAASWHSRGGDAHPVRSVRQNRWFAPRSRGAVPSRPTPRVPADTRRIDLWFTPDSPLAPVPDSLGLLGRITRRPPARSSFSTTPPSGDEFAGLRAEDSSMAVWMRSKFTIAPWAIWKLPPCTTTWPVLPLRQPTSPRWRPTPGVTLSWWESPVAASYNVSRSLSNGGPYTLIANVSAPGYTDTNVLNATTYYYVVSSVDAAGPGFNSAPVAATPFYLAAWFEADAISGLASGASVSNWPDLSGRGNNATQAIASRQPTYVTGAMNGLPVVRFNAAMSNYLSFNRPVQDDFTMACVFQSTQGSNSGTPLLPREPAW